LGLPILLLALALHFQVPLASALGCTPQIGDEIVYAYSSFFPHWLLNSFFGLFSLLVLLIVVTGVARQWRALNRATARMGVTAPVKGLWPSITGALGDIVRHDKFASCEKAHSRRGSHLLVFFGFIALTAVTLWVITAPHNPLIQRAFVYPFAFWDPWKVLANAGGVALVAGLFLMARDRVRDAEAKNAVNSFSDWALLGTLGAVVLTGFATEVLHYVRLEPHRHVAYFVHLVFVFALLMYLPYSKFAHVAYRTVAMVFAERFGRKIGEATAAPAVPATPAQKEDEHA
jgi:quinone-modifying oxidoreductase subunit QmoC